MESVQGVLVMVLPEISRWAPDRAMPRMVTVYDFHLEWGTQDQFVHAAGKITEAVAEADLPIEYAWLAAVNGAEGARFSLVVPHDSWADMAGPEGGFWALLEQQVGRADADAMREGMDECIETASVFLAMHRPDLSYAPSGN